MLKVTDREQETFDKLAANDKKFDDLINSQQYKKVEGRDSKSTLEKGLLKTTIGFMEDGLEMLKTDIKASGAQSETLIE